MDKAGIRAQVASILNRNDAKPEELDTFIEQASTRIQRTLRIPPMEWVAFLNTTEGSVALPPDFLSMKFVYEGHTLIEYLDIGRFLALPRCVGAPRYYTRVGGNLKFSPQPPADTEITLVYFREDVRLTDDTSSNFLTDLVPDLLTYAALSFAAVFFVDERKQMFEDEYNRIYQEITEQALLTEMETSGMAVAPAYDMEY